MSKNIRIATRTDLDIIVNMMRNYAAAGPVKLLATQQNEQHVRQFITAILLGAGRIWIGEQDNRSVGMLISVRNPNLWNPELIYLQELAWWVEPEARRLLYAFRDYAIEQLEANNIAGYTMSKMISSPNLDYSKLGMKKLEETWIGI
jgi:hypothetical protein